MTMLSLRIISSFARPCISMTFCGEPAPLTILAEPAGRSSALASSASTAALALPFSGGAEIRTFSISPSQPPISEREAPGTTFNLSFTDNLPPGLPDLLIDVATAVRLWPYQPRVPGLSCHIAHVSTDAKLTHSR